MPKLTDLQKEDRAKRNKVYELLMQSKELGMYRRPYVRSWRQKHFPEEEFAFLLDTRTAEQIAKYMLHFLRTNKKSWAGQLVLAQRGVNRSGQSTNELYAEERRVLITLKDPDLEGKIVVIGPKKEIA